MLGLGNRPGCLFFSVWPPRLKQLTNTHHRPMTYEESFLDTCGRNGEASLEATRQLFRDHGNDYDEVVRNIDEYTSGPDEMLAVLNRDGRGLLTFLGY